MELREFEASPPGRNSADGEKGGREPMDEYLLEVKGGITRRSLEVLTNNHSIVAHRIIHVTAVLSNIL